MPNFDDANRATEELFENETQEVVEEPVADDEEQVVEQAEEQPVVEENAVLDEAVNTAEVAAQAAQEREIALQQGCSEVVPASDSIYISSPKRYRKAGHMFNIHSWTPVYVNVDNIMNMSFDKVYQAASLGVSGIMQNRLATGVGEFGYSAHKDPYNKSVWRHSGHAKFTYSGLYPVFEASVDFNDRAARQYILNGYKSDNGISISLGSIASSKPYVTGNLKMYIPFNFSKGGWYR